MELSVGEPGFAGERCVKVNTSLGYRANSRDQLISSRTFEHIAGRAGTAQLAEIAFVFVRGQRQDFIAGCCAFSPSVACKPFISGMEMSI